MRFLQQQTKLCNILIWESHFFKFIIFNYWKSFVNLSFAKNNEEFCFLIIKLMHLQTCSRYNNITTPLKNKWLQTCYLKKNNCLSQTLKFLCTTSFQIAISKTLELLSKYLHDIIWHIGWVLTGWFRWPTGKSEWSKPPPDSSCTSWSWLKTASCRCTCSVSERCGTRRLSTTWPTPMDRNGWVPRLFSILFSLHLVIIHLDIHDRQWFPDLSWQTHQNT